MDSYPCNFPPLEFIFGISVKHFSIVQIILFSTIFQFFQKPFEMITRKIDFWVPFQSKINQSKENCLYFDGTSHSRSMKYFGTPSTGIIEGYTFAECVIRLLHSLVVSKLSTRLVPTGSSCEAQNRGTISGGSRSTMGRGVSEPKFFQMCEPFYAPTSKLSQKFPIGGMKNFQIGETFFFAHIKRKVQ